METDEAWLRAVNVEIGDAETAGRREFFEPLLAEHFAFRRATGKVVGRAEFLGAVAPSPPRTTDVHSIAFMGRDRAMVTCVVTMGADAFHNVRLFIRGEGAQRWKLLAWANERCGDGGRAWADLKERAYQVLVDNQSIWHCMSCWAEAANASADDRATLRQLAEQYASEGVWARKKGGVCEVNGPRCETPKGKEGDASAAVVRALSTAR